MGEIKTFYHYTTRQDSDRIQTNMRIQRAAGDFGEGVYLSDWLAGDDCTKMDMAKIIYGASAALVKKEGGVIDYFVKVDIPVDKVQDLSKSRKHLWLYPGENLDLTPYNPSFGEVDEV